MVRTIGFAAVVYLILLGAYSVIAVQLWQNIHVDGFIITEHTNFQDWGHTLRTSNLMAGDFWPQVLLIILTFPHRPSLASDPSRPSIPTSIPIPYYLQVAHFLHNLRTFGKSKLFCIRIQKQRGNRGRHCL